jgi:hypothetical protein
MRYNTDFPGLAGDYVFSDITGKVFVLRRSESHSAMRADACLPPPPLTTAATAGQNWNVTQLMLARLGSTTLTIWSHAIDKARTFYIVSALMRARRRVGCGD